MKVDKEIEFFEIDNKSPHVLYLICDKIVFKLDLMVKRDALNSLEELVSNNNESQEEIKENGLEIFYSSSKSSIEFFKFDKRMDYFYTNNSRAINKYSSDSRTLVQTFQDFSDGYMNIKLTPDEQFMMW